jgi:hypothetical protein
MLSLEDLEVVDIPRVSLSGAQAIRRRFWLPQATEVSPGAMRVRLDRRSILMAATETHWGSGGVAAAPDRYELESPAVPSR